MQGITPITRPDPVVSQIRANIVFENMIVSVLTIAGAAGSAHFLIGVGMRASEGSLSFGAAGGAFVAAIGFAFLFFVAGFAASLAIGIPLFRALERAKFRRVWPYCLAATAVSMAVLAAAGAAPSFGAPSRALYLVPGIAAALVFGRRMRPFWIAAERAQGVAPTIVNLH